MKERLNKSAHCFKNSFFRKIIILFEPEPELREDNYDVGYFFLISRLQKYCTINFICKVALKMFV